MPVFAFTVTVMQGRTRERVAIIGAGVVGLATAVELAHEFEVWVFERHARAGEGSSTRNSGVVHAGLYYPPASLKTELCIEGRERLYAHCEREGIPVRKTGKWIVAVEDAEFETLHAIARRAEALGVPLTSHSEREVTKAEPQVTARAGLYSPESGVVDVASLLRQLQARARALDVNFVFGGDVLRLHHVGPRWQIHVTRAATRETLEADWVVNAAGLFADQIAARMGIDCDAHGLRLHWCKGQYFRLHAHAPMTRCPLIYPCPAGPGLGIHLTANLAGERLLGPDAHFVARETAGDAHTAATPDYRVDDAAVEAFLRAGQRYLKGLSRAHLSADYAGMRPRLAGPSVPFRDFAIERGDGMGAPRSVQLVGIESPGLTASLAIAVRVRQLIGL